MGKSGKGVEKRAPHLFKRGHRFFPPYSTKLLNAVRSLAEAEQASEAGSVCSSCGGSSGGDFSVGGGSNAKVLRPRPQSSAHPVSDHTHRIINQAKNNEMWNEAIYLHEGSKCKKPEFTQAEEWKEGLGVAQSLCCFHCSFVGPRTKLYEEVETPGRGRNPCALNLSLAAAIQYSSVGPEKAIDIIAQLDVPVPAPSSLQKLSTRVSTANKTCAEKGMHEHLHRISKQSKTVRISMDARYNSPRPATSRRHGGNQTSQSVTVAIAQVPKEDRLKMTQHPIVATNVQNKVCVVGTRLRQKGIDVQCGVEGAHEGCTATIPRFDGLSEKTAGKDLARQIAAQGVTVTHVTTDGDASGAKGVQEEIGEDIIVSQDTIHLSQNLMHTAKKANWGEGMFPGVTLKGKRNLCSQALATDIKNRSTAVLMTLHAKHAGKIEDIKKAAEGVVGAIILCYQGDCENCGERFITGCSGEGQWIRQSGVLQGQKIDNLYMNNEDVKVMKSLFNMTLGPQALEKTQFLYTTQANESFHRTLSVSLPKNIKFSQNLYGRLHCRIEVWNQGPGKAVLRQRDELCLPTSPGLRNHLRKTQRRSAYKKAYRQSPVNIKRQHRNDALLRQERLAWVPRTRADYAKGAGEGGNSMQDHSYHQVNFILFYVKLVF